MTVYPAEDLSLNPPVLPPDFPEERRDGRTSVPGIDSWVGVHQAVFGPGSQYFADLVSTVNHPAQIHLYKADGTRVAIVEDNFTLYSEMVLAGTVPFFEFITTLTSGTSTDAFGSVPLMARIMKPPNFSPDQKYPVLVYIYGGPYPSGLGLARVVVNSWYAWAGPLAAHDVPERLSDFLHRPSRIGRNGARTCV